MTPMDNSVHPPAPVPAPSQLPVPAAAALWDDQPELFERLRRRLASYAPNTQRALAADWRAWCAGNERFHSRLVRQSWSTTCSRTRRPSSSMHPAPLRWTVMRRDRSFVARAQYNAGSHRSGRSIASPTMSDARAGVKAARSALSRGRKAADQKAPLRWPDVEKALATRGDDPPDLSDRLLCGNVLTRGAGQATLNAVQRPMVPAVRSALSRH